MFHQLVKRISPLKFLFSYTNNMVVCISRYWFNLIRANPRWDQSRPLGFVVQPILFKAPGGSSTRYGLGPLSDKVNGMNVQMYGSRVMFECHRVNGSVVNGLRNMNQRRSYSSHSTWNTYSSYWPVLNQSVESVRHKLLFPGSFFAATQFSKPFPRAADCELLTTAFIYLLEKYVYHIRSSAKYIKITLSYEMILPDSSTFSYTLGNAIPLLYLEDNVIDLRAVYEKIEEMVRAEAEKYKDSAIKGVKIRFYFDKNSNKSYEESKKLSDDDIKLVMKKVWDNCVEVGDLPDPKSLASKKCRIPKYITALKNKKDRELRPFIVADIETLLMGDVHVPYAAGYLVVKPGDDLSSIPSHSFNLYFSKEETKADSYNRGKEFKNAI